MTMRFKLFGNSGLRVSELCLGALTFGEEKGFGADKAESRKVWDAFVEAGCNFIDTANHYTWGTSEKWCGEFMGAERDRFVLATKFSLNMREGDPNAGGNHRKNLVQSVEASLKRLGTDYIDLYWLHQWEGATPVEEVMRALDDLVRAGKVLYVGISDTPAWVAAQANTLAALRGWSPFVGLQIEYSLIERTPERELIPMARAFGLAVALWGVVGGGVLTGKYSADPAKPQDSLRGGMNAGTQRTSERGLRIAAEVQAIAGEIGRSPAQVALNWVRQQAPQMIPIVGARTEKHAKDNLACLEFELDAAQLERLDAVSRIEMGFPYDFLSQPRIVDQRWGGTYDRLDPRRWER